MTRQDKLAAVMAAVLTTGITCYSFYQLIVAGTLSWHIRQPETRSMAMELLIIWLLFFLLLLAIHSHVIHIAGGVMIAAVFCWLHQIFWPVLVSGLYAGFIILTGRNILRLMKQKRMGAAWDFCFGSMIVILIFCILSLFSLASIRNLRWIILTTGLLQLIYEIYQFRSSVLDTATNTRVSAKGSGRWQPAAMAAAILMLLFLQAGRLNLAIDFDSIWYGVRSHVMLDSGGSIYENLGTLGVVYTYPKGFEVLTLPLAGLPSYSFITAFNLWVSGLVLFAAWECAKVWMKQERAIWVPFLMAALPGIMNMAITAKADLLTLFYQLLMVQAMFRFIKDRRLTHLIPGLAAAGISLAMKPTALVYTLAIAGMSLIWLIGDWRRERSYIRGDKRLWIIVLAAAAALLGIWGRTMKLVGIPVTSVFYQVFERLGFRIKYPFYASAFPSAGKEMSLAEKLMFYGRRLYGVLLNPQGDDMAHVIIAWGTVLPLIFLLFLLLFGKGKKEPLRDQALGYFTLVLSGVLFVNLVSLYSLYQIDGNYYILFYALLILGGCIWLDSRTGWLWQCGTGILLLPWCYAVMLCCITNWAWSLGFSPVKVVHGGYYNHQQQFREEHARLGCQEIWNELAAAPQSRVIALGEHPRVLTFPCNVQSYVDVSGYWGNPEVVSDAEHFLEYLRYAGTDYIYMEQQYVDESVRIYQIVRRLIEEGWLYDVRDENGNLIIRVAHGQVETLAVPENLVIFDTRYIQHP